MKKQLAGGIAAIVMAAALGACGDDGGGDGDIEAFCRLSAESDDRTDLPTDEDFEEFIDVSPEEIRDDVETLFDAFRSIEDTEDIEDLAAAFDDEEVVEATERIEAFEEENC